VTSSVERLLAQVPTMVSVAMELSVWRAGRNVARSAVTQSSVERPLVVEGLLAPLLPQTMGPGRSKTPSSSIRIPDDGAGSKRTVGVGAGRHRDFSLSQSPVTAVLNERPLWKRRDLSFVFCGSRTCRGDLVSSPEDKPC
jgi:hypothetical protein